MFFFYCRTKSVTQYISGFIERRLMATQRVLRSRMRLSEQWLSSQNSGGPHVDRESILWCPWCFSNFSNNLTNISCLIYSPHACQASQPLKLLIMRQSAYFRSPLLDYPEVQRTDHVCNWPVHNRLYNGSVINVVCYERGLLWKWKGGQFEATWMSDWCFFLRIPMSK